MKKDKLTKAFEKLMADMRVTFVDVTPKKKLLPKAKEKLE